MTLSPDGARANTRTSQGPASMAKYQLRTSLSCKTGRMLTMVIHRISKYASFLWLFDENQMSVGSDSFSFVRHLVSLFRSIPSVSTVILQCQNGSMCPRTHHRHFFSIDKNTCGCRSKEQVTAYLGELCIYMLSQKYTSLHQRRHRKYHYIVCFTP